MNEHADHSIQVDERCFSCGADASHLTFVGTTDEYRGGMRCDVLACDVCGESTFVGCDIILDDDTLLHDHDEAFQCAWWDSQQQPAPTQTWFD